MLSKIAKVFILLFVIVMIAVAFGFGFWFGQSKVVCQVCPPEDLDFSLFWETWQTIQEKYVGQAEINVQELIYGAISGMVDSLNDPYTVFLKPDDTKRFVEDVKGSFEGVGMEIDIRDGQLQVVAPLEGTPAQKAGLRAGDKIMGVDGESTLDITVDEAVSLIRGPKGTEVVLTIFREEWGETKDIKIIRGVIDIPSLKLEIRDDNIAYLKLYQFSEVASFDFREAAAKILNSDADRIILDLRNNPGGYLDVAQDIAGWFLEKGQVVVIEDFGKEKEQDLYLAQGNSKLLSYPVVILINKGSASGSEILAGALRDNRGIKLIGETSFGKGSVQELAELREGSSLKVTIAKWLTPKGDFITDKGLEPDIMVEMTEEDYSEGKDPQLDKTVEIIKELN
ncbi:MAG: S41 family peptidase [Candidatus Pacebacteria bacterium]|nr:S41 family peptidase [Candidatus Paceibacterota bacterium]